MFVVHVGFKSFLYLQALRVSEGLKGYITGCVRF